MSIIDRENSRKQGVASAIAGVNLVEKRQGRPTTNGEVKKKIGLSITPSLYENIQKISYMQRISVSKIVSDCLEKYLLEHEKLLAEYDKIEK